MASFRFEIKSDNKKNGGKISAVKHVLYINREGKYKDIDQKDLEKMSTENYIAGKNILEHQPGREILLYSSPFGVIKQDDQGIKVSRQASNQTTAIALLLAQTIYGEVLLHGDEKFISRGIRIAHDMELGIEFDQSLLDKQEQEKELIENERRRFVESGGRIIESIRTGDNGAKSGSRGKAGGQKRTLSGCLTGSSNNQSYSLGITISEKAQRGFCVPILSGCTMDVSGQHTHVLLPKDEYNDLQRNIRERREACPKLRWNVSSIDGAVAKAAADEIAANLQLNKTVAASHVQYINRESRFKQRGGCTKTGHHLPAWANGSAKKFFAAADKYEAQNGERYKEIVFSLPNELNASQQEEIVKEFLSKHLQDYYYTWAIHDKIGSMSDGERHTHVHIMFSTRRLDEYERSVGREPELFFKRAASEPKKGGCKKAAVWNGKGRYRFVSVMRENLAIIQNEVLKKYGYDIKVDHRSIKARREEALAQGNMFLAEILNRVPESAIGPNALLDEHSEKYQKQKAIRKYNARENASKIIRNILSCNIALDKIAIESRNNNDSLKAIQQELLPEEKDEFALELQKIQKLESTIAALQSTLICSGDAITEAMLAHMSTVEKKQWHEFRHLGAELKNWQMFRESVIPQQMKDESYKELMRNIHDEEAEIRKKMLAIAPKIRKVSERLCSTSKHESIQTLAGEKIYANSFTRKRMMSLLLEQKKLVADFGKLYQEKHMNNAKNGYTSAAIAESLAGNLHELYQQSKELREQIKALRPKVISQERALAMAKNNYVTYMIKHQASSNLQNFASLRKMKREVMKKSSLGTKERELISNIEQHEKILETFCAAPAGQKQIHKIMAGILQKNSAIAVRYAKLNTTYKAVQAKISSLKVLEQAARSQAGSKRFRLSSPVSLRNDAPKIAAGIAGDEKFAPLIMKSKGEEYDDWELLTEAEKDEIREKNR